MPKPIEDLIKEAEREVKFGSVAKADLIFQEAIQQIKEIKTNNPGEFLKHYIYIYWNFACSLQKAAEKKQKNNSLNEAIPFYEKAVEYFMQYAELRCEEGFLDKDLKNIFKMFDAYYATINVLLTKTKKVDNHDKKMEADLKALLQYKHLICFLKIYIDTLNQRQLQNGEAKTLEKLIQLYDKVLERAADICVDLFERPVSTEQKIEYCNLALDYYDRLITEKDQREQSVLPDIYLSWLFVNAQKSKLNEEKLADAEKVVHYTNQVMQANLALVQKADVHLYRRKAFLANNDPAQAAQETQLFKESFVAAKENGLDVSTLKEDYQKLCESKPIVVAVAAQPVLSYPVHPKKRIRSIDVEPDTEIQAAATDIVVECQPIENELSEQQKIKIQELEAENERLKAAAMAAQAEFETAQKKMLVLEAECVRLQAGLASQDSIAKSYQDLQRKLQAAWQENNSLKEQNQNKMLALEAENARLQEKLASHDSLTKRYQSLKRDLQAAWQKNSSLDGQNQKLTEELRQLKRQRDEADSQINDLVDQRRALEAQNARLEQQVNRGRIQRSDGPAYQAKYDSFYPDDRDPRSYPYPSYRY